MPAKENKALTLRFVEEVINEGNLTACDELVAFDFAELGPLPGEAQGREGLKQIIAMLLSAFPDMHWTVVEQVAEGDKVVRRFVWRGTYRGAFFEVPPTGRQVTVPGVVIDRIVARRMHESRTLMDTLNLMQQLGAISSSAPVA